MEPPQSAPLPPDQRPRDDWTSMAPIAAPVLPVALVAANRTDESQDKPNPKPEGDPANAGLRREPGLPEHVDIAPEPKPERNEFEFDDAEDEASRNLRMAQRTMEQNARNASLDPSDGIDL